MDSSVSPKDEIWFLRVCHHISYAVYYHLVPDFTTNPTSFIRPPLMRTPRLPVVDWTDAPTDLNGLVRFAERRNLVPARVPSHFIRSLLPFSARFHHKSHFIYKTSLLGGLWSPDRIFRDHAVMAITAVPDYWKTSCWCWPITSSNTWWAETTHLRPFFRCPVLLHERRPICVVQVRKTLGSVLESDMKWYFKGFIIVQELWQYTVPFSRYNHLTLNIYILIINPLAPDFFFNFSTPCI